jgi:hypothetical protein
MRKFLLVAAVAAIGTGLLALPASASFDHHFTVIAISKSGQRTHDGFKFREKLVAPWNHRNQVGHDRVECTGDRHAIKCKGIFNLNGEIGGAGRLRGNGNLGPGDHKVNIVGGTNDFNGAAGKLLVHDLSGRKTRLHFDIIR